MAKQKKVKPADGTWGQGSVRQRGGKWQVRWREAGSSLQKSQSGFSSRAEAVDELERIQHRLGLGQPGVPKVVTSAKPSGPRPLPELVKEWVEYRIKHGRRMAVEEQSRWALHLARPLETQTLEGLTSKWVRDLAGELVKPTLGTKAPDGTKKLAISGPTAQRVLTLLSSFLSWGTDEGLVTENVARVALRHKDTKKLLASKHDGKSAPYLKSWADVDRLYGALRDIDPTVALYYYISARAGLRPGEVLALRWGDVDLAANTIEVERQVRGGKLGPTKSGKPRTVPIGTTLATELTTWRAKSHTGQNNNTADDLVCPPPVRTKKNGTPGKSWGKYLGPKSIAPAWAGALKATGIKRATVYAYGRHTFGSLSGLGGLSAWRLQQIMGHSDIKTTLRYVSLAGQALTAAELQALG